MGEHLAAYLRGATGFLPWSVEIHPTAKCNHRCIHCSYKERNESRAEMSEAVFLRLVESLKKMSAKGVYFSGGGEPSLYPSLKIALKQLTEHGIEVAIVTNGTAFEQAGLLEDASRFNYIALSVPSCERKTYEKITGRDYMERVISLPEKIHKRFGEKSPVIGARVVVTNLIAEEVPEILRTLKKREFDYVIFKAVRDYEDRGLGLSEEMADALQKEIHELAERGELDTRFTNLGTIFDYRKAYSPAGRCHINEMGLLAVVTPEGDVYPNIAEIGHEEFRVGNICDESFEVLWNGTAHRRVKVVSNQQWQQGKCQNCRAISYNMRIEQMVANVPKMEDPFL